METGKTKDSTAGFWQRPTVLVGGITCLASFLCFWNLGDKSIWWDESVSIGLARADWSTLFQTITHGEANMGLYYFLLHFWVYLGSGEFAVRSFSAVFAVLTIPVTAALGFRLFNTRVGLTAAVILAVNVLFVKYAQEARSYSLVLFLASLSTCLFVEALLRPAKWKWALYILTGALTVYAHVFAALVPAAHAISLLFFRREALPWKALLIAGTAILVLISPIILSVLTGSAQNIDWILQPGLMNLVYLIANIAGGEYLLAAFMVCGLIALLLAIRARSISWKSPRVWRYAVLVCWLIVPIIIAFAVSQFKPVFTTRYFIICCTPMALLAAIGISRLPGRWLAAASIVIILTLSSMNLKTWYFDAHKQDWREAAAYILSKAEKGDAIVFYAPYMSTPFSYYREKNGFSSETPASVLYFSPATYTPTPVLVVPADYSVGGRLPPVDPGLTDRLTGYGRVWLVISHENYPRQGRDIQARTLEDMLKGEYGSPDETDFNGIRAFLYTPR
jgi:mannosyltransferase